MPVRGTRDGHRRTRDGHRAAVVEAHVLQRRATVRLLEERRGLDVVHEGDSIGDLLSWMRVQERRRWPHLIVVEPLPFIHVEHELGALVALREAGVRMLLLSSLTPRWGARRVVDAGVDGVVSKLDDEETLAAAVAGVLDGRSVTTAAATVALTPGSDVPRLSTQESRVLDLYVAGQPIASVAKSIGVREDTARKYLNRIKRKYEALGRPARSKLDLALHAWRDGFADLRPPTAGAVR